MFARLPLNALRTFESAARLCSFKAAAAELNVTPTAVSHQVRMLEAEIGCLLFERLGRGVRLSDAGERLQRSLHGALLEMQHGLDALRPRQDDTSLVVSITPAFAALWLIPRLGHFYRQHPGIRVRMETTNELTDLLRDSNTDLAIRCGFGSYPHLFQQALMAEWFATYATASVLERLPQQTDLIDVAWAMPQPGLPNWQDWRVASGEDWTEQAHRRDYPDEHYALQAALSGQGLVLASSVLVSDALSNGLLTPYRADVRLPGARYLAVCVPGKERRPAVQAFLRWLETQALNPSDCRD
ncbi:LysR substrate-binding domain-containing protein [Pseudomonas sp. LRF_L74]|uniref:LysR substrate-binding domain-containing protein n=1 Tax=Pseudomonas sp. LRF_L74 TaxID=3369422 RepID=UPI003F5F3000